VSYLQQNETDLAGKAVLAPPDSYDNPTALAKTLEESVDGWRALNITTVIYVNTVCRT